MRHLRIKATVVVALVASATAVFAGENGSIDLFPFGVDPVTGLATTVDLGQCQGTPSTTFGGSGQVLILGVFARLNGISLQGIAGAELFVDGIETLPGFGTEWSVRVEYAENLILGEGTNALYATRILEGVPTRRQIVAWPNVSSNEAPNCQKEALTELARIYLTSTNSPPARLPDDWRIRVTAGDPPSNPNYRCPLVLLCPYPAMYCVTGGEFILNPVGSSCTVAVQSTAWGQIKALFR